MINQKFHFQRGLTQCSEDQVALLQAMSTLGYEIYFRDNKWIFTRYGLERVNQTTADDAFESLQAVYECSFDDLTVGRMIDILEQDNHLAYRPLEEETARAFNRIAQAWADDASRRQGMN